MCKIPERFVSIKVLLRAYVMLKYRRFCTKTVATVTFLNHNSHLYNKSGKVLVYKGLYLGVEPKGKKNNFILM